MIPNLQSESVDEDTALESRILASLEGGPITKAQLRKKIGERACSAATLELALTSLLSDGRVFAHYKPLQNGTPSKKIAGYALSAPAAPAPSAWISSTLQEFEDSATRANVFGLTRDQLLIELLHSANVDVESIVLALLRREQLQGRSLLPGIARALGVPLGRSSHRPAARESVPPSRQSVKVETNPPPSFAAPASLPAPRPSSRPRSRRSAPPRSGHTDTEIVLHALGELREVTSAESAVAIAPLRIATHLDKRRFDRAVLALASFGSIELVSEIVNGHVEQVAPESTIEHRGARFSAVVVRRNSPLT